MTRIEPLTGGAFHEHRALDARKSVLAQPVPAALLAVHLLAIEHRLRRGALTGV
jgi:hypothetical protein